MAYRIIALGGEPATGKSYIMRRILKHYNPKYSFVYNLITGRYCKKNDIYFIGIYDRKAFSGTDRLSMACQPDFIELVKRNNNSTFVFEGDRLFNQSLFDKLSCNIFVLSVSKDIIDLRHSIRKDNQSKSFKLSKLTKINKIIGNNNVTLLDNNSKSDNTKAINKLIKSINNE